MFRHFFVYGDLGQAMLRYLDILPYWKILASTNEVPHSLYPHKCAHNHMSPPWNELEICGAHGG